MLELAADLRLLHEALHDGLLLGEVGPQHLERDVASQILVPALVDRPHPALADLAQHLVPRVVRERALLGGLHGRLGRRRVFRRVAQHDLRPSPREALDRLQGALPSTDRRPPSGRRRSVRVVVGIARVLAHACLSARRPGFGAGTPPEPRADPPAPPSAAPNGRSLAEGRRGAARTRPRPPPRSRRADAPTTSVGASRNSPRAGAVGPMEPVRLLLPAFRDLPDGEEVLPESPRGGQRRVGGPPPRPPARRAPGGRRRGGGSPRPARGRRRPPAERRAPRRRTGVGRGDLPARPPRAPLALDPARHVAHDPEGSRGSRRGARGAIPSRAPAGRKRFGRTPPGSRRSSSSVESAARRAPRSERMDRRVAPRELGARRVHCRRRPPG